MINWKFGLARLGYLLLFAVGMSLFPVWRAEATHLRAGEITVERISCVSRQFRITVTVYTDTGSPVLFGGEQDVLDFGDGNRMLVPETLHDPTELGPQVGKASFSVIHIYPGPGRYTISYLEPNRNEGVLNIDNSVLTTFYIETQLDLSVLGCNNSTQLKIPPIDQACVGVAFFHNPGAYDPDGDSLSFKFVTPFRDRNVPVANYRDPNSEEFYLDFAHGNEDGTGVPEFHIDPVDGTITWNAPGKVGEYNIAFVVQEWRKVNGIWKQIGFVRRDMQIIVASDCTNDRPELLIPEDVCVEAGTTINETILGTDPNNNNVKIEAFSEIFAPTFESPATLVPNSGVYQPTNPTAELQFAWNTTCDHVKDQAYLVVFKITDDPSSGATPKSGPPLIAFGTWRITVVGPAPVLQPATVNLATRRVQLEWDPYECFQQASTMQIWRRVDDTSFTPDECVTGMPESLGFSLIAQIPIKNGDGPSATPVTTFTDTNGGKGLAVGARYCYRIVALFPSPFGGESYVSNEVCIDPILADAPVITHVTVDKTSVDNNNDGEITIQWTPPFDIDPVQFPGPKEYLVQRASGTGFINVSPQISALTFTDGGLDTRDLQYSYRIVLYSGTSSDPTLQPIDTSSLASSVWLDLSPQKNKIELNWNANVPWSIQLQSYPLHDVYRGPEGSVETDLFLIESVNVIEEGLTYLDTGKLEPGDSLFTTKKYCYRVLTRGGYGNPAITEPLINYSQINCAQPTDDVPPCAPVIAAFVDPCNNYFAEYSCESTSFTNTIRWNKPEGACAEDIKGYNIYASTVEGDDDYDLIAQNWPDTFYLHQNQPTLAYCYRIAAVDRSNNVSTLSDPVCNNNCAYYELPNVFSPNGDGCNDLFSAFGVPIRVGETYPECSRPVDDPDYIARCARHVQKVDFTVYNRWGKKVYHFIGQDGSENTIYIEWDGRDEKGRELASAVYYYVAEVTFDVIKPSEKTKLYKGWVHLVR